MSTDLFKQVNFNDGEGVTHTDINDLQRYLESKIWDQIVHNGIGALNYTAFGATGKDLELGGQDGANHPTTFAYCLNPGAAFLRAGSANNKIQISPGTLLQKIGATTGNDPQMLAYTFVGTEEWTLSNGDATNPRVDLLQMKLEYITADLQVRDFEDATTRVTTTTSMSKKRQVQATLTVKSGVPAASPTIPDPDAGYVPVGSVMVGNGWTIANAPRFGLDDVAALNNAVVHDQRMPVRVRAYTVMASQFYCKTNWSYSSATGAALSSSATNELQIPCPAPLGRLLGIAWLHFASDSGATRTLHFTSGALASSATVGRMVTVPQQPTTNNDGLSTTPFYVFEANQNPSAGPTILQSLTNKIGVPVWTKGGRCALQPILNNTATAVANPLVFRISNASNASDWYSVTYYIAEGL